MHLEKPPFLLNFCYRSVIGELNYLAQTMRLDILYATHQLGKYSSNPREPHGEAVLHLICYLKKTRDLGTCCLIKTRVLSATVMLTFLAIGTSILLLLTQVLPSHAVAGSCSMQDVRSFGHPSCRHKLLCPLLRLSTLPCLNHYETYFPLCFWSKKFARRVSKSSVPSPTYTARFLKTTPVHWNSLNLLGFQSFVLIPSTSAYVTITFANTYNAGLSRSSQ